MSEIDKTHKGLNYNQCETLDNNSVYSYDLL